MATIQYKEFHVVPTAEPNHIIDGGQCFCEPRCVIAHDTFRLFVHNTHQIKIVVRNHDVAPLWWNPK